MKRITGYFSEMGPKKSIEYIIFNSKWLLIPFFLKLIFTMFQLLWIFSFKNELPPDVLVNTLGALDIVMVACLVKMIMTGSYNSFISKDHGYHGENLSSSSLKIKMGTSIVGVSSIDLLKIFVNIEEMYRSPELEKHVQEIIWMKILIHAAFILGGAAMVWIGYNHIKMEKLEQEVELAEEKMEEEHEQHAKHHTEVLPKTEEHPVI